MNADDARGVQAALEVCPLCKRKVLEAPGPNDAIPGMRQHVVQDHPHFLDAFDKAYAALTTGKGQLVSTGHLQEVNPTRQMHAFEQSNADIDYALKAKTHLWIVIVSHRATDSILDSHDGVAGDGLPILDADTMLGPPAIACYVCEQAYEPLLRRRKCPGEAS